MSVEDVQARCSTDQAVLDTEFDVLPLQCSPYVSARQASRALAKYIVGFNVERARPSTLLLSIREY